MIEALTAVTLTGVLLAITVPAFTDFLQRRTLQSAAFEIHAGLRFARSVAISRNVPVAFCAGDPAAGCTGAWWYGRWMAFRDPDVDGELEDPADMFQTGRFRVGSSLLISANGPLAARTVFLPQGHSEHPSGAFGAGRVRLCQPGLDAPNAMDVILSAGGRARSEHLTVDSSCPGI